MLIRSIFFTTSFSILLSTQSGLADVTAGVDFLNAGDVSAAAEEFAQAYEAGDPEGAFYLGRLFELGLGTDQDEMRAANLYSAAAEAGSAKAQARLGLMYHEGRVLLRDYSEGTRLICAAADAGDPDGLLNCGIAYQLGRGVELDLDKAKALWEQSAAKDNVLALNVLGQTALDAGDLAGAVENFKRAADLGNAGGMYEYSKLLSVGSEPNMIEAYAYANLAVVRGLAEAIDFRDNLEAQMSSEDILAGQRFAREWTEQRIVAESTNADGN